MPAPLLRAGDDLGGGIDGGGFVDGANYLGKACFKRFRIWAANSKSKGQYDYNVQFRNMKTGEVCTVDPFIRNG